MNKLDGCQHKMTNQKVLEEYSHFLDNLAAESMIWFDYRNSRSEIQNPKDILNTLK